jgi:hypothetical protein
MGHLLQALPPQSKKWREVYELLGSDAPVDEISEAATRASDLALKSASGDPAFQFVSSLLVHLPLMARAPSFEKTLADMGIGSESLQSLPAFLAGIGEAIDRSAFERGRTSDVGIMAKSALLESLSQQLRGHLPTLFEPTAADIRNELARFARGQNFARLARDFVARLTYRSLDYYLSRELANHTGGGKRFASDADRTAFQRALAQHSYEASEIVEIFAGGWYGKNVWQKPHLDQDAINGFTGYAFTKMRAELERRRAAS